MALSVPAILIVLTVILALLFKRRWFRALMTAIFLTAVGFFASASLGWLNPAGLSLGHLVGAGMICLVAVLITPRRRTQPEFGADPNYAGQQAQFGGYSGENEPVDVDERAFQQWLDARGLLGTSLSPERMLDLRRQFAGLA